MIRLRLLKLIISHRWSKTRLLLQWKGRKLKKELQALGQMQQNDINLLTVVCSHNAPTDIVRTIVGLYPLNAYCADEHGMLPLHVACLIGASSDTVRLLLDIQRDYLPDEPLPSLATATDKCHRTALHFATQYICDPESAPEAASFFTDSSISLPSKGSRNNQHVVVSVASIAKSAKSKSEQSKKKGDSTELSMTPTKFQDMLHTVTFLLQTNPEAVLHPDMYGQTPIDMLQDAKATFSTYSKYERVEMTCQILRENAVEVWKSRKIRYEILGCQSYDDASGTNGGVNNGGAISLPTTDMESTVSGLSSLGKLETSSFDNMELSVATDEVPLPDSVQSYSNRKDRTAEEKCYQDQIKRYVADQKKKDDTIHEEECYQHR